MADNISWHELYADAMLELDRVRLQCKIEDAQVAIRQAIRELSGCNLDSAEEIQALNAAMGNLETLQRVEFSQPGSAGSGSTRAEG